MGSSFALTAEVMAEGVDVFDVAMGGCWEVPPSLLLLLCFPKVSDERAARMHAAAAAARHRLRMTESHATVAKRKDGMASNALSHRVQLLYYITHICACSCHPVC